PAARREETGSELANSMGGTAMGNDLRGACNAILEKVAAGQPRVPGLVAMIRSRSANIYEGAAGERVIGGQTMTPDTVFAIFSTTKAITGTAILQCVEEETLDPPKPMSPISASSKCSKDSMQAATRICGRR